MPSVTAIPVDASNTPAVGSGITEAAKALANDENYCNITTQSLSSAHHTAVFSDWDDIASGLPSNATITGVQAILPEFYGNVSQVNMYLSVNAGSAYSSAEAVNLSGMTKGGDSIVTTPSADDDLWGLTWDVGSLDWDDVWLKISVDGGTSSRELYFDYVQLKVIYTAPTPQKPLTINGSLTVNGTLIIK